MIILIILVGILLIYILTTFNSLRTFQVRIKASIQEIGNQLKRQTELIPNLVESAKGYLKHEKEIFDKLTEARTAVLQAINSGNAQKMIESQEVLAKAIQPLRVIVESNPQLQAAGVVTKLMDELRDTADKVMYARRTLIDLTADYNTKLVTIPSGWIASLFGFKKEQGLQTATEGSHLEVEPEETKTPKVTLQ